MSTQNKTHSLGSLDKETEETLKQNKKKNKNHRSSNTETVRNDKSKPHPTSTLDILALAPSARLRLPGSLLTEEGEICSQPLGNVAKDKAVVNEKEVEEVVDLCVKTSSDGPRPFNLNHLGPYLAGLIEGDGTIAVHNVNSTAKKYSPMIIIVFKLADLPVANYLRDLTNCGKVYRKSNRGYVLWQIRDLVGVFTITKIVNGYMRTPKIEALHRVIT